MSNYNEIAQQFVQVFYETFSSNRANLGSFYRDHSMWTFEKNQVQGSQAIIGKLQELPFQKVQHKVDTLDAQPCSLNGQDILIVVTGQLVIDDSEHPQLFTEVFHLINEGGNYYVFNDIFKFVVGS